MNQVITDYDTGVVFINRSDNRRDELITAASETTYAEGTIFARAADGQLVPFVKGGDVATVGTPVAILHYDVEITAADVTAGTKAIDIILNGEVRQDKLIILADGNASNVDGAVVDQLRNVGLIVQTTRQLAEL